MMHMYLLPLGVAATQLRADVNSSTYASAEPAPAPFTKIAQCLNTQESCSTCANKRTDSYSQNKNVVDLNIAYDGAKTNLSNSWPTVDAAKKAVAAAKSAYEQAATAAASAANAAQAKPQDAALAAADSAAQYTKDAELFKYEAALNGAMATWDVHTSFAVVAAAHAKSAYDTQKAICDQCTNVAQKLQAQSTKATEDETSRKATLTATKTLVTACGKGSTGAKADNTATAVQNANDAAAKIATWQQQTQQQKGAVSTPPVVQPAQAPGPSPTPRGRINIPNSNANQNPVTMPTAAAITPPATRVEAAKPAPVENVSDSAEEEEDADDEVAKAIREAEIAQARLEAAKLKTARSSVPARPARISKAATRKSQRVNEEVVYDNLVNLMATSN